MRLVLVLIAGFLGGCGPAPEPVGPVKTNGVEDNQYREAVEQLAAIDREAERLFRAGKLDQAGELITKGQPLMNRVLSVSRPTLEAMEAASNLDDLYGRMLLRSRNYGWARMLFQKNLARWKNWRPESPETVRRRRLAEAGIAECDRGLMQ